MALTIIYYNLTMNEYVTNKWTQYISDFNAWCLENCVGFFEFDLSGTEIRCNFEKIEEAMAFKLRWF